MAASSGPWLRQGVYILVKVVDEGQWHSGDLVDDQDEYQMGSQMSLQTQVDGA